MFEFHGLEWMKLVFKVGTLNWLCSIQVDVSHWMKNLYLAIYLYSSRLEKWLDILAYQVLWGDRTYANLRFDYTRTVDRPVSRNQSYFLFLIKFRMIFTLVYADGYSSTQQFIVTYYELYHEYQEFSKS